MSAGETNPVSNSFLVLSFRLMMEQLSKSPNACHGTVQVKEKRNERTRGPLIKRCQTKEGTGQSCLVGMSPGEHVCGGQNVNLSLQAG